MWPSRWPDPGAPVSAAQPRRRDRALRPSQADDRRLTLAVYAQATTEGDDAAADTLGNVFRTRTGPPHRRHRQCNGKRGHEPNCGNGDAGS